MNKGEESEKVLMVFKFYQTTAEKVMKSINVEIKMELNIGIATSYCKPNERRLDDYLKAIDLLTFS